MQTNSYKCDFTFMETLSTVVKQPTCIISECHFPVEVAIGGTLGLFKVIV